MKAVVWMNGIAWSFGSLAIIAAVVITKSALPLFAFLLLPRWTYHSDEDTE